MKFCLRLLGLLLLISTDQLNAQTTGNIGSIQEDATTPFTYNVADLGLVNGIAITSIPAEGGWSFWDGVTWWDFRRIAGTEPISPTNALLLPENTPLRYTPPRDFYGVAHFDYVSWDQGIGTAYFEGDATNASFFGTDTYRVEVTVTPVNDAPKLTGGELVLRFDGANDYASFMPSTFGGVLSFETWFYVVNPFQTWIRLFEFAGPSTGNSGNNLLLGFASNSGKLFYNDRNLTNQISNTVLQAEQWAHVVVTHETDKFTIYLNGEIILTGPTLADLGVFPSTRTNMYLAKSNYPQDNFFGGDMRQFRVWKRALSAEEVLLSYNGLDITGDGSDLLANLPLNGTTENLATHPDKFSDLTLHDGAQFMPDQGPPPPVVRYVNNSVPLNGMVVQDVDNDDLSLTLTLLDETAGVLHITPLPGLTITGNMTTTLSIVGDKTLINEALESLYMMPALNWIGELYLDYLLDDLEGDLLIGGGRRITILPLPCESPADITCNPLTLEFNGEASFLLDAEELVTIAEGSCEIASVQLSTSSISCQQLGQTVPVNVVVTDANGAASACTSQITVGGLPCGWRHNSGSVGSCVSDATFAPSTGVWTTTATNCIYNSPFQQDMLMFAQRTLCGDGSITAQVTGISGGLPYAGITMRESNATGSKKVQMMINRSSNTLRREVRYETGGQAFPMHFSSPCERVWLRLIRTGNVFRGYTSQDGLTWWYVMQVLVPMNSCVEIGLVLTNMQAGVQGTATFANVSYTGGTPQPNAYAPDYGTAIEDMAQLDVNVFPNPTSGQVQVDLIQYAGKPLSLEVFDINGQLVWAREWSAASGATETLDLSTLPVGTYALRVKSAGLTDVTKRILLQRP